MHPSIKELLKSGGAYPTGACSAWPQERRAEIDAEVDRIRAKEGLPPLDRRKSQMAPVEHDTKVKRSLKEMAKGFAQTAGYAAAGGRVVKEVRDERYDTCQKCPHFIEDSKRCSECGCFMEMKTWINGPKNKLCPLDKWER